MAETTASKVINPVPVVQAIGVEDSIKSDGSYGQYDVQISVSYSPKSGTNKTVASKTLRMSATQFAAFREETNTLTGEEFFAAQFPDEPQANPDLTPKAIPTEGNVPVFAYEANDTADFKVPDNVQAYIDAQVAEKLAAAEAEKEAATAAAEPADTTVSETEPTTAPETPAVDPATPADSAPAVDSAEADKKKK